jgi:hypothetical protein
MYRKSASRCFRLSLIAIAIHQIFTVSAFAAQTDAERIADLEKKLAQSMQQIQELSARLTQLESAKTAQPAINTAAIQEKLDSQNERIEKIEKNVEQTAESNADQSASQINLLGVPVHGFMALGYAAVPNNPNQPNTLNTKSGFNLSNVDFYLAPNFGDKMKALMELNYEYTDQGILTFDLERFQAGYTFSDALTLWAGRFHTPFGVWNTAFHHGPYIQVSTERPRFVAFEDQGGIMPSHTVGLMGSGTFRLENGDRINYDAFVGNGSRIIPATDGNTIGISLGNQLDFNPVGNDKTTPALGGRVSYVMSNGLTLGVHALSEKVNTYDMNNVELNSTQVSFWGGFYFYESDNWESIAEYYRFSNKDDSGGTGTHSSWAAFAQLSYAINNLWTPYVRYEKAALDQTDNYFASLLSGRAYDRQVLGLRWDFNKSAALKFEFNRTNEQELDGTSQKDNEYRIQYSLKF